MVKHIVRAVVFLKNSDMTKFLLLHKVDPDKQWWQTVAGGWESPESFKDGAIRETVEETGLKPIQVYDLEYEPEFMNSKGEACQDHFFAIEVKSDSVTISGEHDDYLWAVLDEALAILGYRSDMEGIRKTNDLVSNLTK